MSWSKEIIIQQILELHKRKEPLSGKYIRSCYPKLFSSARYHFRNWKNAVLATGLDYNKITLRKHNYWTEELVVQKLQERYKNGLSLNVKVVQSEDSSLYNAASKIFGKSAWKKARIKAGLNFKYSKRHWNRERVLSKILQLCKDRFPLSPSHIIKSEWGALYSHAVQLFGSWRSAVQHAGLPYDDYCRRRPNRWWNKERVIAEIQRCDQQGMSLSHAYIARIRSDLANAARVYWGSWGIAVEAAEINYRDHLKRWSRKDWLRRLSDKDVHTIENRAIAFARHMGRK